MDQFSREAEALLRSGSTERAVETYKKALDEYGAKVFEVEVRIKDQTYGRGTGPSKQIAAQVAAQTALESLRIT